MQSWLSLIFPKYSEFLNLIRDCYEAYVLYIFMQLLIEYLNGEQRILSTIDHENVILFLK